MREPTPGANLSMGVMFATVVFIGVMAGLYLYYLRAKHNRARIASELGE